jgi:hypothetical protein
MMCDLKASQASQKGSARGRSGATFSTKDLPMSKKGIWEKGGSGSGVRKRDLSEAEMRRGGNQGNNAPQTCNCWAVIASEKKEEKAHHLHQCEAPMSMSTFHHNLLSTNRDEKALLHLDLLGQTSGLFGGSSWQNSGGSRPSEVMRASQSSRSHTHGLEKNSVPLVGLQQGRLAAHRKMCFWGTSAASFFARLICGVDWVPTECRTRFCRATCFGAGGDSFCRHERAMQLGEGRARLVSWALDFCLCFCSSIASTNNNIFCLQESSS